MKKGKGKKKRFMVEGEEVCEAHERLRLVEGVLKWKQRVLCMILGQRKTLRRCLNAKTTY